MPVIKLGTRLDMTVLMSVVESHHAEPPKNRSTMTAYQKLVRSPSATLRANSDPTTPLFAAFSMARMRLAAGDGARPTAT